MNRIRIVVCVQFITILLFVSSLANAADWRIPVGLTYVNNFKHVVDIIENNLEAQGVLVVHSLYLPVGLSVHPYVQFDNGLGVGASFGPAAFIHATSSNSNVEADFFDFPLGLDFRYTPLARRPVSPYIRAGVRYHAANGDFVKDSTPGFLGGIGIEFARKRVVGFGMEIAYDSSEIELEKLRKQGNTLIRSREVVRPYGLMASIFIVF